MEIIMTKPFVLDSSEIEAVSGGSSLPPITPIKHRVLQAEDMYGDTMSVEDWMDYMADDVPNHGCDPHDFPGGRGN
jgi:hypothetical protein